MSKNCDLALSVVIPTLGGPSLRETIEHLNRGTVVPQEILICVPEAEAQRKESFAFPNVKIIRTPCRGQVAQRACGFRQAKGDFVLQLDDDVHLRPDCLEELLSIVASGEAIAVGPKLHDSHTGRYHSFLSPSGARLTTYEKFIYRVINGAAGYQPGKIGTSGVNMGVPDTLDDWVNVDWLAGGCLLHRNKNLVLDAYYPFPGKAYAEDLFHSALLRKKGVMLVRSGNAICDLNFDSSRYLGLKRQIAEYRSYARAMTVLIRNDQRSLLRFYLFLGCHVLRLAARKM
jgi:glycosyltransferase involved in cell wall biosynthesis